MHKKLEAELTSLAHSILQMKNREDVFALQKKAHEVYEKLSVLAYVEEYINNTPNPEHTKEELIALVEQAEEKKAEVVEEVIENVSEETTEEVDVVVENTIEEVKSEETEPSEEGEVIVHDLEESPEAKEEITEEELEDVEEVTDKVEEQEEEKEEVSEEPVAETKQEEKVAEPTSETIDLFEIEEKKAPSLDEELQDTIPVDVVADLFENAPKKSLNDKLQGDIQIGLNDRIAFVKHLFGGSQEDFNRVVSQLNTFKTEKEARKFINKMVKPDYDWAEKEEFEERFMTIVERKFA